MNSVRLFLLGALLVLTHFANAQSPSEFTLAIVPHSYSSKNFRQPSIELYETSNHFHVILTNNSAQPIKLFEEWNSWGCFGLYFEITYSDGQKVASFKESKGWDKNFPSTVTIAPHGYYIFEVNFDGNSNKRFYWANSVLNQPGSATTCRMRAIYSIEQSEDAQHEQAWTGTVASAEDEYIIWHPDLKLPPATPRPRLSKW